MGNFLATARSALVAFGLTSLWGTVSHAQEARPQEAPPDDNRGRYTQVGVDGSYAASGVSETGSGGGGALRVGRAFPQKYVVWVPEAGVDLFAFSGPKEATLYGAFGGARLRLGKRVEPGLFAHFGVAGVDRAETYAAPSVAVGISVDVTAFETLLLGVQGEYKSTISTGGNPSFNLYTAGLSAGFRI